MTTATRSKSRAKPKSSKPTPEEKLVKEHNVIIRNFPKDVFDLMMKLSKEVVKETALEGKINKETYDSWSVFKENARLRSPFAEHGYVKAIKLIQK